MKMKLLLVFVLALGCSAQTLYQAGDPEFTKRKTEAQPAFQSALVINDRDEDILAWAVCWHPHDPSIDSERCRLFMEPGEELGAGEARTVEVERPVDGARYRLRLSAWVSPSGAKVEPTLQRHFWSYFDELRQIAKGSTSEGSSIDNALRSVVREIALGKTGKAPIVQQAVGNIGLLDPDRTAAILAQLPASESSDKSATTQKQYEAADFGFSYVRPRQDCWEFTEAPGIAACDHMAWCAVSPSGSSGPTRSRTGSASTGKSIGVGFKVTSDCDLYSLEASSGARHRSLVADARVFNAFYIAFRYAYEIADCDGPGLFVGSLGAQSGCSLTGF